jgi:hypothetical protein
MSGGIDFFDAEMARVSQRSYFLALDRIEIQISHVLLLAESVYSEFKLSMIV